MTAFPLGFAAPTEAQERTTVTVSDADCRKLVEHQPSADVAYKPGVDVRGRPVAPADLPSNASPIKMPDVIEIPISIDLSNRLAPSLQGTLYRPEARIGTVSVRGNQVFFNNEPLSGADQAAFAQACAQRQRKP
ncbi:MAG: hypothetical protein FJX35_09025 [Alphaproteobacteria bacterium]|nr:hypothetical protein [Alphaproteobacteria bacterium]